MKKICVGIVLLGVLSGCAGKVDPRFVPVENFDLSRYLGTWYEIARLDHSFERGLVKVTAEYSMRDDGKVRVVNRGYNLGKNEWKRAEGKAKFKQSEDIGWLEVSFFGPFYAAYIILALDHENYSYALVSGPNTSYLWILSRSPQLDEEIVQKLLAKAESFGFNTGELIFVEQYQPGEKPPEPGGETDLTAEDVGL